MLVLGYPAALIWPALIWRLASVRLVLSFDWVRRRFLVVVCWRRIWEFRMSPTQPRMLKPLLTPLLPEKTMLPTPKWMLSTPKSMLSTPKSMKRWWQWPTTRWQSCAPPSVSAKSSSRYVICRQNHHYFYLYEWSNAHFCEIKDRRLKNLEDIVILF